ncbi:MAG: chloramphenicol acetyltransferase, partial [Coriobacteriia bacterium]|nr:chloramphenicol acetyltransferase [Coriobacteriia bacterium]
MTAPYSREAQLTGPDPNTVHPMEGFPQVCFIKNTVSNPNIIIGDYTYYDDPLDSEDFERNVLYHYPFMGDKLIIGRFCALATGVRFIMNGANHKLDGPSTYPFSIFG